MLPLKIFPNFFFEIPKENFKEASSMLFARILAHYWIPHISAERDTWGTVVTSLGIGVCVPGDVEEPSQLLWDMQTALLLQLQSPFWVSRSQREWG